MERSLARATASRTDRYGWLTGLMQARVRCEEGDERDETDAYECTGCGTKYESDVNEALNSEAQHKAMACCAGEWRKRLPRRSPAEVRRLGYRKLARVVTMYVCPHCEKLLEYDHEPCDCDLILGKGSMRECPLCRKRQGLSENGVSAVVDCCLWRFADHAKRELVKGRIAGGGDPVQEVAEALVECGVLTQADLDGLGV